MAIAPGAVFAGGRHYDRSGWSAGGEARVLQRQTPDTQVVADCSAAMDYLHREGLVTDKIGAAGFCAGAIRYGNQ